MNPALRMYMMTQADQRETRRESTPKYSGAESRNMDPRWPAHNEPGEMREHWKEEPMESRYRGKNGQWKAGTRRSEYDGGVYDTHPGVHRMDDDDEPETRMQGDYGRENHWQPNQWPYAPGMEGNGDYRQNRQIGFGAARMGYDDGASGQRQTARVGGTMWMEPEGNHEQRMTREMAERWVQSMHGEDPTRPHGGRWSMEELKPVAQKLGVKTDGEEFFEFYAITNAIYSDFCEVLKKFGFSNPEHYGMLAKAWIDDKDAMPGKVMRYYDCIVKK